MQDSQDLDAKTKPVELLPKRSLANLYVVAFLYWERVWFETFEIRRAHLLDVVARLNAQMQGAPQMGVVPMKSFLLGGQTVILEDIAAVRPDLLTLLVIYNAGGRLGVGPWYVNVDEALVSGEALLRNLLVARADATRLGLKLLPIVYDPTSSGHIAQLPQILRGFGIDAAFLHHGAPIIHLPFRWQAPDGSDILVINHEFHPQWPETTPNVTEIATSVQAQRTVRPDGPFLWLFDAASTSVTLADMLSTVDQQVGMPVIQGDLRDYARALRQELPDHTRPALEGELRLQALREHTYLWSGTLSARIYLKQTNARLQTLLTAAVEPWMTVALTHGDVAQPQNLRALLNHCWRLLMKTQARNALGGSGSDAVHQENEIVYQQVEDIATQIIRRVLQALPGTPLAQPSLAPITETYIVVWNPHNWPVKQIVSLELQLPPRQHPAKVRAHTGDEQHFGWQPKKRGGTITFLADVPALGYTTYTVETSTTAPGDEHSTKITKGKVIGNIAGETLSVQDGKLIWKTARGTFQDLLTFHDGGDGGDIYNYSPPEPDVVLKADLVDDVQIESAPLYERLIINHRMRVAPELNAARQRERGVKLLELTTTATFYDHIPGIYFQTTFTNHVKDHRLRAHLHTHVNSDVVLVDTAYSVAPRPAVTEGTAIPPTENMEGVTNTQPIQSFVAVEDQKQTLALLVRGLPEYEAIPEDDQLTFALTLVRSVGWLSRGDLRTRTARVAPEIPVPDAQCERTITAEYTLVALPNDPAALVRAGQTFTAPLQAYQYTEQPERTHRSFLSVVSDRAIGGTSDGDGLIVTAIKPPDNGTGWIVRLFNPHDHSIEAFLTPFSQPESVHLVGLAEEPIAYLESDVNGRILVRANPHQIITIHIAF